MEATERNQIRPSDRLRTLSNSAHQATARSQRAVSKYETAQNVADQMAVAGQLVQITGLQAKHTGTFDHYDFLLCTPDGRIHGFFEVKRRNITKKQFSTIYLSEHKYRDCVSLAKNTGLPVYFVVLLKDGVFCAPVTEKLSEVATPAGRENYHITMSCNAQRNDLGDVEPMVQIPVRKFIEINQINLTKKTSP